MYFYEVICYQLVMVFFFFFFGGDSFSQFCNRLNSCSVYESLGFDILRCKSCDKTAGPYENLSGQNVILTYEEHVVAM